MKTLLLLICFLVPAFLRAQDPPAEKATFETQPYSLDRYGKLLGKSPFDFDVEATPPPPPPPPMEGWGLAGLTKTADHQMAVLVNLKTQERIRLNHYNNPPTPRANSTKQGSDIYTLEEIQFEEDGPPLLKNAKAIITKNGERSEVAYSEEAATRKAGAAPVAGHPGAPVLPGVPPRPGAPAQPGAANGNNAALMKMLQERNSQQNAPANSSGQPQPVNGSPFPVAQPQAQAVPQPVPAAPPAAGGTPPAARRRVVLPTEAAAPVPAPAPAPVTPAPNS